MDEQSAAARAALRGTVSDLQANLRARWEQATDLRCWVERHPWIAVGAASAAGFTAAAVVTPAAGESLGEKLSQAVEAVMGENGSANGEAEPDDEEAAARRRAADRRVAPASMWAMLLEPVVDVLKVALQNYLMAFMAGQAAAAAQAASAPADDEPANRTGSANRAGPANRSGEPVESTETNASALA